MRRVITTFYLVGKQIVTACLVGCLLLSWQVKQLKRFVYYQAAVGCQPKFMHA